MAVPFSPMPPDLETAREELRALGLSLPGPAETLCARALVAEMVGLPECLAIQDLLAVAGYGAGASAALHAALLALFSARTRGSLCLSLVAADLVRTLAPLAADGAGLATALHQGVVSGEWSELVGIGPEPFRPVVLSEDGQFLYLRKYYLCERRLRDRLAALTSSRESLLSLTGEEAVQLVRQASVFRGFRLNAAQMWGVYLALQSNFVVVTGGPGTGKTTLVTSLLRALDRCQVRPDRIALIAPTGRAAQRLTEALGHGLAQAGEPEDRLRRLAELEGTTIHRLLRFQARRGAFAYDEDHQLPIDAVIVDEVSMVDVALMERLLAAVRPGALVVFLGDKDQLPSVAAGAVLADLIPTGGAPGFAPAVATELRALAPDASVPISERSGPLTNRVVVLTESKRLAGGVSRVAQRINAGDASVVGELPALAAGEAVAWPTDEAECVLLAGHARNPEALHGTLASWVQHHWLSPPDRPSLAELLHAAGEALATSADGSAPALSAALARLSRGSILTVLRRGAFGVDGVNRRLADCFRRRLDPGAGRTLLFAGAPVLVTRNTPGLGLFNGDLGLTVRCPDGRLVALFQRGSEVLRIPAPLLPPHELAFALTVHKSQGSEYDNVLLVIPPGSGHRLLTREIVYTAITRSRGMVGVWAEPTALADAVRRRVERCSALGLWPDDGAPTETGIDP